MSVKLHRGGISITGATVLAPVSWGTTYVTVTELLPDDRPLFVAAVRVLPAGLVLVIAGTLVSRWRPRGAEWGRTGVLALFNFGVFFPLLIVAVYRLPGGVAAAAGGLQPLLVAGLSGLVAGRKPRALEVAVAGVAAVGVALVVIRPGAGLDPLGVLAAVGANVSFATGVVLTKRFPTPANRLAATGWQLLLGGVFIVPLALAVEGAPPSLDGHNIAGFAYLSVIATALAFVLWFNGIARLPAAAPPLLGLAAPITGAALGWVVLDQSLSPLQLTGFVITIAAVGHGATMRPVSPLQPASEDVCAAHTEAGMTPAASPTTTRPSITTPRGTATAEPIWARSVSTADLGALSRGFRDRPRPEAQTLIVLRLERPSQVSCGRAPTDC